jgi:type VI secretion system secreted protein VgrG
MISQPVVPHVRRTAGVDTMSKYLQSDRPLKITTPLGPDILLLRGFQCREEISRPFELQAEMVADRKDEVRFDQIIGQSVTVEIRLLDDSKRYFNGIVKRFSQAARDEDFVHFRAHVVPKFWLLTKKVRSRIFQHLTVPDILKQLLTGFDVNYDLTGVYYQRDYCVQYRESDFDFASRLMEEEGIYYFFQHSDGNHQMMVSDNAGKHPAVPGASTAIYEEADGEPRTDMRVTGWEKIQEMRAGECTLWDYCFEIPTNHLEAKEKTIVSVPIGKVTHKLNLANGDLEIYDHPGRYAQRFDGIDPSGGDRPADISHIFEDRTRTVRLRMEQEEVLGIRIQGKGDCGQFTAGHKFKLERHFDADASYLLTSVEHQAQDQSYRSDDANVSDFTYENRFTCIPEALRYRPQRATPVPAIAGMQTATVVGPPGEEIWVDKYGRVKVQFHWDREGKLNADSSCWLRVAQVWAGKGWGAFFWPRIGHEVVVVFEEGDPDQPLIIGSVYNADNMPWFTLPAHKAYGGFKSESVTGTASQNYNGIVFNDTTGNEHLSIHSERNMSFNTEFDKKFHAGRHKGERVSGASVFTVGRMGGGSGGGFDAGNTMPEPPPIGVMGLNSTMVFGENLQVAAGLNHQLSLGNNIQLCINPLGMLAGIPGIPGAPALTAALGAAAGGNMQFTIGTSANFVLGQEFDINLGPPKIEISGPYGDHPATIALCGALSAASIAFTILYHQLEQDQQRASLVVAYQAVVDALLISILAAEIAEKTSAEGIIDEYRQLICVDQDSAPDDSDWGALSFGAGATILASMLVPIEAAGSE